jgi:hypothetical protein
MSEQEPSAEALKIANGIAQMRHPPLSDESREVIARDIDAYTATRVAEAVAAERARIVGVLKEAQDHIEQDIENASTRLEVKVNAQLHIGLGAAIAIVQGDALMTPPLFPS